MPPRWPSQRSHCAARLAYTCAVNFCPPVVFMHTWSTFCRAGSRGQAVRQPRRGTHGTAARNAHRRRECARTETEGRCERAETERRKADARLEVVEAVAAPLRRVAVRHEHAPAGLVQELRDLLEGDSVEDLSERRKGGAGNAGERSVGTARGANALEKLSAARDGRWRRRQQKGERGGTAARGGMGRGEVGWAGERT